MSRHIQTEVDDTTHRTLEEIARKRNASLKQVTREALEEYARHVAPVDEDPLWKLAGTLDLPAGDWSERKGWRFAQDA